MKYFIKVYGKKASITDRNTENTVHVFSDCVTSYDLKKLPEMLAFYKSKGCEVRTFTDKYIRRKAILGSQY